ncbi:hypothetical protein ATO6_04225 [Oceanicola sp. 22II-s10i]|uniref:maleylacetoacetate isomerase n=1 Tax=Oceanicola sp. 22II-s10i TaxID=1317116 RepID=UPI000B5220A4|nr:maleylacetoacetate isomerase [Oceanicola sp. 22II-s10i]OWU86075.1 hypothetical protein ATO6_04225 [Oceanicola sp. 22II-s10i]
MKLIGRSGSSASYRVRIALALKGAGDRVAIEHITEGAQYDDAFRALNPQMRLPCLVTEDGVIVQSMAILEYLDEVFPDPPLLPGSALDRARSRAIAQIVVADIHPLQNTGALRVLGTDFGLGAEAQQDWARHWIRRGLAACEELLTTHPTGPFATGDTPGMADICLIPQMRNAARFGVDISDLTRLAAIAAAAAEHPAFIAAHPDNNPNPDD